MSTDNSTNVLLSTTICLFVVAMLVIVSRQTGSSYIDWAYNIGDQPIYRLIFLIVILIVSQCSFSVALLLAMLFMVINSMVPLLTNLDETFVFGTPLTNCSNYDTEDGLVYPSS